MTINAENISVCQEALYLLRQDVGLPSVAEAPTDTSLEWQKSKLAFDAAIDEVWNAHDWNAALNLAGAALAAAPASVADWTAPMRSALAYCVARELAIPLAGRVQDLQNWHSLYKAKLAQARVVALQTELDAISDTLYKPVLRLILPNFTPADDDLPRSIKTYTDRIDAERDAAQAEVWNAHDWTSTYATATSAVTTNWSAGMKDALVYLLASKLAMPTARKEGEPQGYDQLYRDKLAQARVVALHAERQAVRNQTHIDLLSLIVPRFDPADDHLPRSIKTITDRADALADSARYAILSDHDWNFARVEDRIAQSCPVPHGCGPYFFAAEVPPGCAHLEAVLTHSGRLDDWKVFEGRVIVAREPVVSVVYTRDEKRSEKWPPLVRRAYLFRLAADTAQTEVPQLFAAMEAKADDALAEAKARDARESNTPRDAWGRNHHVDAMRGIRPDGPRLPRHSFHGLV